jgi:hypothetical protein
MGTMYFMSLTNVEFAGATMATVRIKQLRTVDKLPNYVPKKF